MAIEYFWLLPLFSYFLVYTPMWNIGRGRLIKTYDTELVLSEELVPISFRL